MFNFRKKSSSSAEEKEKKKEQKKQEKKQQSKNLNPDELKRLEEVRRSFKKDLERPQSLPPPPPPRPRGILKGKNFKPPSPSAFKLDDADVLLKNTAANEAILYENIMKQKAAAAAAATATASGMSYGGSNTSSSKSSPSKEFNADREVSYESVVAVVKVKNKGDHLSPSSLTESDFQLISQEEIDEITNGESAGLHQRKMLSPLKSSSSDSDSNALFKEEIVREVNVPKNSILLRRGENSDDERHVFIDSNDDRVKLFNEKLISVEGFNVEGKTKQEVNQVLVNIGEQRVLTIKVKSRKETQELASKLNANSEKRVKTTKVRR